MVVGAVLLLVGVGVITFLLQWERQPPGSVVTPEPDVVVPDFAFRLDGVRALDTGAHQGAAHRARHAARNIRKTLTDLYVNGFVDPNSWRRGRFGELWSLFTKEALPQARAEVETLTIGSDANDLYEAVHPKGGVLKVRVLLDRGGHPSTAVASVDFFARGNTGERFVSISSAGQYFLRPQHNEWSIYAYELRRDDRLKQNREPPESAIQ